MFYKIRDWDWSWWQVLYQKKAEVKVRQDRIRCKNGIRE
jgi:hypothetical protein